MKKLIVSFLVLCSMLSYSFIFTPAATYAAPCNQSTFFGLPTWYKYLETEQVTDPITGGNTCDVKLDQLNSTWLIVAAIIEILLRVAAFVALGFIVYAGFLYITSQSQPDKTKQALMTIINAIIGLVIAIVATALVTFIAGRF